MTQKQKEQVMQQMRWDGIGKCNYSAFDAYYKGYAAAIKDAEVLVEALKEQCTCFDNNGLCEACEALAKWRGE